MAGATVLARRLEAASPADRPVPHVWSLELQGGFRLLFDGALVVLAPSCERLLALLALHGGPLLRVFVAGTLWGEVPDHRAAASLRSTMWRLPRNDGAPISATGPYISLSSRVAVDVREATQVARMLLDADPDVDDPALDESRLCDDVLPDWYDEWVLIERERFRQLRLHALEALCRMLSRVGRYDRAVQVGVAAVAADPLRESAHRVLIQAHLGEGNPSEAMRQYRFFRGLLRRELGLDPSEQMQWLVRDLI